MWQWFALDRPRGRRYLVSISGGLVLAACSSAPPPVAPAGLPPLALAVAVEWVARHQPERPLRYDLRWMYETQKGQVRGRGAVRMVPPDTLRFDYRAPFGRSGAAVVVGDSVLWSEPEDEIEGLIRIAPLFWAALGVARMPGDAAVITGRARESSRAWRYATGTDTLTYAATPGGLRADMRRSGDILGWVDVRLIETTGVPERSTMLFPKAAARFFIDVRGVETLDEIDPEIWKQP